MNFLGQIGIDINLVLAQIVNFGLLVFILYKFVYKPIFKKIEEDEGKIREVQTKSEQLDAEKKAFEIERNKTAEEIRQKTEMLLTQAEEIANDIKTKALQNSQKQADEILSQAKKEIINNSIESDFTETPTLIQISKDKKIYSGLEDLFFEKLMSQLKTDLVHFDNLGDIVIETAHPLPKNKRSLITIFIKKYIGENKKIIEKENKDLIAGFRVLTGKVAIDQNLLFEINNAK